MSIKLATALNKGDINMTKNQDTQRERQGDPKIVLTW